MVPVGFWRQDNVQNIRASGSQRGRSCIYMWYLKPIYRLYRLSVKPAPLFQSEKVQDQLSRNSLEGLDCRLDISYDKASAMWEMKWRSLKRYNSELLSISMCRCYCVCAMSSSVARRLTHARFQACPNIDAFICSNISTVEATKFGLPTACLPAWTEIAQITHTISWIRGLSSELYIFNIWLFPSYLLCELPFAKSVPRHESPLN